MHQYEAQASKAAVPTASHTQPQDAGTPVAGNPMRRTRRARSQQRVGSAVRGAATRLSYEAVAGTDPATSQRLDTTLHLLATACLRAAGAETEAPESGDEQVCEDAMPERT